jgi:hypothetical protein
MRGVTFGFGGAVDEFYYEFGIIGITVGLLLEVGIDEGVGLILFFAIFGQYFAEGLLF